MSRTGRATRLLIRHRGKVILAWIIILVALTLGGRAIGTSYQFDISLEGSRAMEAVELLTSHSTRETTDTVTIAWKARNGQLDSASQGQAQAMLDDVAKLPHVKGIMGPDQNPAQVSADGTAAYASVLLDAPALEVGSVSINTIIDTASGYSSEALIVGSGGSAASQSEHGGANTAEIIGMLAAAIILVLAFGSFIAAGIPLIAALIALGSASAVVGMLTHATAIPPFAPQLVSLIVIGVGIDYALFIVSRHRAGLRAGRSVEDSIVLAMDTSGRAVAFAGIAVAISLGGLVLVGIGFLNGLAAASAIGVLFAVCVSLTLTPVLLSYCGMRVLSRKDRRRASEEQAGQTRWAAWAMFISRHPWAAIAASIVLLGVMAAPAAQLRLGSADQGSDPAGSPTRVAYDILSDGFGPGMNGPLLLVGTDKASVEAAAKEAATRPDVAFVAPVTTTVDGAVSTATVIPATGPQDEKTSELIHELNSADVTATGYTAIMDDFSTTLQQRLPWFLLGVIGLSSILLLIVFRSIAIPVKAAAMNLLAAGASFGVLVAVFQWGWGLSWLGVEKTGPIDAFLPVMLLAILFGLSMDYQVFLVSRIREEWDRTQNNDTAVAIGLGETGRVITAAAMIMVSVFTAFAFAGNRTIAMFGVGLAVAIFVDAFIIRSLLVPALMHVLGRWNWWIPSWLARVLPRVTIEGHEAGDLAPGSGTRIA